MQPWAAYVTYQVNDLVTYNGKTYKAIQGHTSLPGWEPAGVPALWSLVN
ncbi:carbohydrate-binding protein [Paenibacillus sp. SYP-B3998]